MWPLVEDAFCHDASDTAIRTQAFYCSDARARTRCTQVVIRQLTNKEPTTRERAGDHPGCKTTEAYGPMVFV